jgi:hypothetical protein
MILQWDESFDIGPDTLSSVKRCGLQAAFLLTAKLDKLTIKVELGHPRTSSSWRLRK